MYLSSKRVAMFVACLAAAGPALSIGKPPKAIAKPAGAAAAPDGQEIVVTGARPVVVGARARPCVALPGDPLDSVKVEVAGPRRQDAIVPMRHGYAAGPDGQKVTGPDFWQSAGTGLDQYRFRTPEGRGPSSIGARSPD